MAEQIDAGKVQEGWEECNTPDDNGNTPLLLASMVTIDVSKETLDAR